MRTLSRWRLPVLAAAGLAIGAAAGGGTLALWNGSSGLDGATITAGDLDAQREEAAWTETSQDVLATPHVIEPAEFLVRQGDTVTAEYDVVVTAEGDNMRAAIDVAWSQQPDLPAGVTGTYTLLDDAEAPVSADVSLGQDADELDALELTSGDAEYTLLVELDFTGLEDRFGSDSAVQTADLGEFTVALRQIRTGGGFE